MTIISDERLAERGVEVLKRIAASKMPLADADFIAQWVHDARQALRAQGGVRLKPLEWVKHPEANIWRVFSLLGTHHVIAIKEKPAWTFDGNDGSKSEGICETAEEAKSAAQADYERRILSAIEASPAPVIEEITDQMVEVACKVFIPHWETCTLEVRADVFGDMRSALTAALAAKGGQ